MFYDGGFQPAVYQPFLDIPALASNVGVRTFPDLLATIDITSTYVFTKLNVPSFIITRNQKNRRFLECDTDCQVHPPHRQ